MQTATAPSVGDTKTATAAPTAAGPTLAAVGASASSVAAFASLSGGDALSFALQKSLLSDKAILKHMSQGSVVIEPFVAANLSTSSYDVTLGRYYFRESPPEPGFGVYNPYSAEHVARVWGSVKEAESAASYTARTGVALSNISPSDEIVWIAPGETILGHTNEFVGGRATVTTMMKARSSMGRNFIEVCKCAGWGDVGYCSRWTMEITNNSRYYSIPLVVGRRIAQIVFFDSDGTLGGRSYATTQGKYQTTEDLQRIMTEWTPQSCLPRMFADREIRSGPAPDPLRPAKPDAAKATAAGAATAVAHASAAAAAPAKP